MGHRAAVATNRQGLKGKEISKTDKGKKKIGSLCSFRVGLLDCFLFLLLFLNINGRLLTLDMPNIYKSNLSSDCQVVCYSYMYCEQNI